jgi:hypothetical protein
LGIWIIAGIAEVLDPKGLRKGMNRPDTNQEDQKADDQLANYYFCIRLISSTKQELLCLVNNALTPTSLVS